MTRLWKALQASKLKLIYKSEFWNHAPFDKIQDLNLCTYVFDMAVNMGIAPAIKALQRALWAYKKDRECVVEDGILGDSTLAFVNGGNCMAILSILRAERAGDYRVIVAKNPEQSEFINGWLNRAYEG